MTPAPVTRIAPRHPSARTAAVTAWLLALCAGCGPGTPPDDARAASDAVTDTTLGDTRPADDARDGAAEGALPDATADAATPDANCDRPEGGAACTPGHIGCSAEDCPSGAACCVADGGAHCMTGPMACEGAEVELRCEEASDCPAGQVCCSGRGVGRVYQACAPECSTLERQVCRTSSECAEGTGPCQLSDCGGYTVQTCLPLPPQSGCHPI